MISLLVAGGSSVTCVAGVHDGGVGACNICHVMHADEIGIFGDNPLLTESNSSDLCLGCHATSLGSVLGMDPLAPPPERGPGNFVFLLEDNLNDGPGGMTNPISGDAAGHNLNAPGYGLAVDATYITSPGGSFPASQMKCTSCHDPHGNASYRFLRGPGNDEGSGGIYSNPAPDAVGLDLVAGAPESNANHVAYRSGMGMWCGNCHGDYIRNRHRVLSTFRHSGNSAFKQGHINQYNLYNGSLDPTGGIYATAYLATVPFEDTGSSTNSMAGPTGVSRVFCLSCHRAHGSSGPSSGRWDFNVQSLGQDGVESGSYALPNPYPDPNQDSLCSKCHKNVPGPVLGP